MWWSIPVVATQPGLDAALVEARNSKRLKIALIAAAAVALFFFLRRIK